MHKNQNLAAKWNGPHKVLWLNGLHNVEIQMQHNNKKMVVHVNRLKPYLMLSPGSIRSSCSGPGYLQTNAPTTKGFFGHTSYCCLPAQQQWWTNCHWQMILPWQQCFNPTFSAFHHIHHLRNNWMVKSIALVNATVKPLHRNGWPIRKYTKISSQEPNYHLDPSLMHFSPRQ